MIATNLKSTLLNLIILIRVIVDESRKSVSTEDIIYHKLERIDLDSGIVYYILKGNYRIHQLELEKSVRDDDFMQGFIRSEMSYIYKQHINYLELKKKT